MPPTTTIESLIGRFVSAQMTEVLSAAQQAVDRYANSRTSKQLIAFLGEIGQGPGEAKAAEAHRMLAAEMQRAAINSWGQAKRRLRPAIYNPPRVAAGAAVEGETATTGAGRFSGGVDKALRSSDLVSSSARGVQFAEVAVLDRFAAQWARINFGAGGRGEGSNERFSVRFSNLPAIEYVFEESARPGYGLPRGGFKGPDGRWQRHGEGIPTGAFYPVGGSQQFPTRGNVGFRYLDAGVRRYFERIPSVYGALFRDVLEPSQRRGRPPIVAETVRVTSRR